MKDRSSLEIAKQKKARGATLGLLSDAYPQALSYVVIERLLVDAGAAQAHDMPRVIAYLQDKAYIVVTVPEEPDIQPMKNAVIRLCAHGIDLLEGSIPEDTGVDF